MAEAADLTGQRFGLLTATSYAGSNKGKGALWSCRCDCGNVIVKSAKMLIHHGKYASCGCYDGRSKRLNDLTGRRFGQLTVLRKTESDAQHKPQWLCQCDCGKQTIVKGRHLNEGGVKSCGCAKGVKGAIPKPELNRHTLRRRLFRIWRGMHYRCEDPKCKRYKDYGGRGIFVCEDWSGEKGLEHFSEWALAHGYNDDLSIDRIDVDGNYEPSNCRWATWKEQANNKRNTNR